jgi:hypothetical protein
MPSAVRHTAQESRVSIVVRPSGPGAAVVILIRAMLPRLGRHVTNREPAGSHRLLTKMRSQMPAIVPGQTVDRGGACHC